MTALPHSEQHRVIDLARRLCAELAEVADVPLWSMTAADAGDALVLLTRARSQLDGLLMRVLRHAESSRTGADVGATTTSWWAHETGTTRAEAHRTAHLAERMEHHVDVAEALATGTLRTDQARVVVDAIDDLPDDVDPSVRADATTFLLEKASEHDARALRVLGRRVLEVVDPETADAEEGRRLEAEEREAAATASFTMVDDGHGKAHGRFTIPTLHGEMLRTHLLALVPPPPAASETSAAGDDPGGAPRLRGLTRHRLGLAFMDYLETRPEASVPTAGGVPATVVVTMELETLTGGARAASLDTGPRISAGEARRLACRAGIIPIVLGGPSVVLDAGRKRRFHSQTQRIAMGIRDGGCTAAGCDAPPGLTQAHHDDTSWSQGGGTSVARGRLYCPRHHRLAHDAAYLRSVDAQGKVRFVRRT
ncbi:hypothetical protein F4692_003705 [Nocardioides cavernae]|uniref:DUF222 domain-containing protein n=1 Tax=Nocardioides cavernae TaxID=1921566 RepID=A0A7Y9H612_9ACTN|nr:HNH endonuclease signature motif containing protein [Nocardioides cavernae]NYE38555.1 hypothetical protein [Nocardioides cavernae]